MAEIPETGKNITKSADTGRNILSAMYANSSDGFKQALPKIDVRVPETLTPDNLRAFGSALLTDANKVWRNEFLDYLLNRIGRVIISSKLYDNPWSFLKEGVLELGELIEDIFVDLCDPHDYDPGTAEKKVFEREKPNVYSTLYCINYQKFYKQTIQTADLRKAFLSWEGIADLTAKITEVMYTSANYDEYVATKWMLVRLIIDGKIPAVSIPDVTNANMDAIAETLRSTSANLTFMGRKYNRAGVATYTDFTDQYIFIDSEFEAKMDVQVLASAFNLSKADFLAKRVLVDGFGNLDTDRLTKLFGDSDGFTAPDKDTLDALNKIPAVTVDRDYFKIYDNLLDFGSIINPQGLYENFTLHVWKTFASSPFKNAVMFIPTGQSVTSVSISPVTATVTAGQVVKFTADVKTSGFAPSGVNWTVADNTSADTVIANGTLIVGDDETAGTLTVTAVSDFDSTKTADATVTVV